MAITSERGLIDFHCHILPGMDDGAQTPAASLELLRQAAEQGVLAMVCTPHYYPEETVGCFLERRREALRQMTEAADREKLSLPRLILGAEVAYYPGILKNVELERLCIGDTRYMLLELPFEPWAPFVLREIYELTLTRDIIPVIAHLERYRRLQKKSVLTQLMEMGFPVQANSSFLLDNRTARRAKRLVRSGQIHLLGSDCHDPISRPQTLGAAFRQLNSWGMGERAEEILALGRRILKL